MAETLPPIPIAFAPNLSEEPRVRRVQFGDGYEARIGDGLNTISMKTTLPWKNRTHQETAILLDFFRRHKGIQWFYWVPHGESRRRKFVCSKWSYVRSANSPISAPRFDISAEIYEVHDLGA